MALLNDLRYRVTVYGKQKTTNALGEVSYDYAPLRTVWAGITITNGTVQTIPGDMERAQVSHRFTFRAGAMSDLTTDMYFLFRGQRYDVQWWQPHYKNLDRIEVLCSLVVE